MSKYRNSILDRLPASELASISLDLKTVSLDKDTILFEPGVKAGHVFFPTSCVISFLGDTGERGCIEVWAVGCDGVAGVSSILGQTKPFRGVVQVSGDALVAKIQLFRRQFQKYTEFHDAILRYYDYLLVQVAY